MSMPKGTLSGIASWIFLSSAPLPQPRSRTLPPVPERAAVARATIGICAASISARVGKPLSEAYHSGRAFIGCLPCSGFVFGGTANRSCCQFARAPPRVRDKTRLSHEERSRLAQAVADDPRPHPLPGRRPPRPLDPDD